MEVANVIQGGLISLLRSIVTSVSQIIMDLIVFYVQIVQ